MSETTAPERITRSRIGAMTYLAPLTALVADEAVQTLQAALNECVAQHQVSIVVDLGKVTLLQWFLALPQQPSGFA